MFVFFFFQAEDGIRDVAVTGVQTCALPIFEPGSAEHRVRVAIDEAREQDPRHLDHVDCGLRNAECGVEVASFGARTDPDDSRSEERRVGKECRSRWSPYH